MRTVDAYLLFSTGLGAIETFLFFFLYTFSFQKRKHFLLRAISGILLYYGVWFGVYEGFYAVIADQSYSLTVSNLINFLVQFLQLISLFGIERLLYKETFDTECYSLIGAEAGLLFANGLYSFLLTTTDSYSIAVFLWDAPDVWSFVFYFLSIPGAWVLSYFILARPFMKFRKTFDTSVRRYLMFFFALVIVFLIFMQGNQVITTSKDKNIIYIFDSMQILFSLTILLVLRYMLLWSNDIKAKNDADNLYESYRKQYTLNKQNIDLVNIKCHDLKHQINRILSTQNVPEEYLKEVENTIRIYDTKIETGNENLNVVLQDFCLRCEGEHIPFSSMIDGKAFSFLSPSDMYSLFGNALDNALEAEKKEKEQDRFIRLSSHRKGDFLYLRLENYCSKEVKFDSEHRPLSTKTEEQGYHGYGTQSIRQIAEKYKGNCLFKKEDSLFVLLILFDTKKIQNE